MIYLLFHDRDTGAREEWNTFYTPCEAFATREERQARRDFLSQKYADLGIDFHELDPEHVTVHSVTEPVDYYEQQLDWEGDDEDDEEEDEDEH